MDKRTRENPRYQVVSARICDADYDRLRKKAEKDGKTICKLVSEIIKEIM